MNTLITKQLKKIVGETNLLTDPAECLSYSYDNSRQQNIPAAVVFAKTDEQVAAVVKLCYENTIPITPRGRGTGTTGGSVPEANSIVLSLERMNNIIGVYPDDRYMIVEAGVTNAECQKAAKKYGFFWPPDPSSAAYCTIGGNLAFNSAGPRAIKYGTPRENTLGLTAIMGTGEILHTGVKTTKGVVGYDLTRLLIGSEGTLGIITRAILKLSPLPETRCTVRALFRSVDAATQAIAKIMAQPIIPYALEFMDSSAINLIQRSLNLPAETQSALLIEIDDFEKNLSHSVNQLHKIVQDNNLIDWYVGITQEEQENLWRLRKSLSPALRHIAPEKINEDVVVPVSQLPALMHELKAISAKFSIPIVNFGHAGNGNIHVNLLYDPEDTAQMLNTQPCLDAVFKVVLKLGGTLSGEHGVGLAKKPYISMELEQLQIDLMRKIKKDFDPKNILNPGKIFSI